jgi:hypothetical protein
MRYLLIEKYYSVEGMRGKQDDQVLPISNNKRKPDSSGVQRKCLRKNQLLIIN